VANALSPAQVLSVVTKPEENTAEVVVPDRQLSLAIGKEGQNARLAAKLTGWRIDIKSQTAYEQEAEAEGLPLEAAQAPTVEPQPEVVPALPGPQIEAPLEKVSERPLAPEEEAVLAFQEPGEAAPEEPAPAEAAAPAAAVEAAPAEPAKPKIRFAEELLTEAPVEIKGKRKAKKGAARKKTAGEGEAPARAKRARRPRHIVEDEEEEYENVT
jgi:N utilization substance protein A